MQLVVHSAHRRAESAGDSSVNGTRAGRYYRFGVGWHGSFQKKGVFTKRTQLKNVEVFCNEVVVKKCELGSFCKKAQKNRI